LLNEIFYSNCIVCDKQIHYSKLICFDCINKIEPIKNKCSNCGNPLGINTTFCKHCLSNKNYDYLYALYWYKKEIRLIIKNIKFQYGIKGIFEIKKLVSNTDLNIKDYDLITVCPSHFIRKFRRFVHPADIVAKTLSSNYKIKYKKVLKRIKNTEFQWKMKRNERFKNVKGAFSVNQNLSGLKILLVDDILTTGATINECAAVLKNAGADKIDSLTLSRGFFI
jgi:ComF family protein